MQKLIEISSKPPIISNREIVGFQQFDSRDRFQAMLDNLYHQTKNPLLIAVIGEIGNNSFDHNLGKWQDISGVLFSGNDRAFLLADRGQGLRSSLSRVTSRADTDLQAIEIAFTQKISGRSPENRGNGLKFVSTVAQENHWQIYFQSGLGICQIKNGQISLSESTIFVYGCCAAIHI